MKELELREHAICSKCKKPIGHTGLPLFWTAEFKRHGIKMDVVKRQDGLTAMLGGNAVLAQIMGADEEMTQLMCGKNITLCEDCAFSIMELIEECGGFDE
jgi:hypothetical protein